MGPTSAGTLSSCSGSAGTSGAITGSRSTDLFTSDDDDDDDDDDDVMIKRLQLGSRSIFAYTGFWELS